MALRERKARVGAIPEGGMADIAFLLLVFFLVTTTIDMDKGLGIILPAEGQELEINKKNILKVLDQLKLANATRISIAETE